MEVRNKELAISSRERPAMTNVYSIREIYEPRAVAMSNFPRKKRFMTDTNRIIKKQCWLFQ